MATVLSALRHRRRSSSVSRDSFLDVLLHRREPSSGSHSHEHDEEKRSLPRSRNASKTSLQPSSFKSRNSMFDVFKSGHKEKDRDKEKSVSVGVAALVAAGGAAAAVGSDEAAEAVATAKPTTTTPPHTPGAAASFAHILALGDDADDAGEGGVPTRRPSDPPLEKERGDSISVTPFVAGDSRRFSLPGDEVPLRSIPICAGLESDPAETAKPVTRERQTRGILARQPVAPNGSPPSSFNRFEGRRRSSWTSAFAHIPDPSSPNPAAGRAPHAELSKLLPATLRWVAAAPGANGKAHRLKLAVEALAAQADSDGETASAIPPLRSTARLRSYPAWQTAVLFHAENSRCDQCLGWYDDAADAALGAAADDNESDGTDDDEHAAWVRRLKAANEPAPAPCVFRATGDALDADRKDMMESWDAARGEKGARRAVARDEVADAVRWVRRYQAHLLRGGPALSYGAVVALFPDAEGKAGAGGEVDAGAGAAEGDSGLIKFPTARPYRHRTPTRAGATTRKVWKVHNPDPAPPRAALAFPVPMIRGRALPLALPLPPPAPAPALEADDAPPPPLDADDTLSLCAALALDPPSPPSPVGRAPASPTPSGSSDEVLRGAVGRRAHAELRHLCRCATMPAGSGPPPPPQLPATLAPPPPSTTQPLAAPAPGRTASPEALDDPPSPRPRLSVDLPRKTPPLVSLHPATPDTPADTLAAPLPAAGLRPPARGDTAGGNTAGERHSPPPALVRRSARAASPLALAAGAFANPPPPQQPPYGPPSPVSPHTVPPAGRVSPDTGDTREHFASADPELSVRRRGRAYDGAGGYAAPAQHLTRTPSGRRVSLERERERPSSQVYRRPPEWGYAAPLRTAPRPASAAYDRDWAPSAAYDRDWAPSAYPDHRGERRATPDWSSYHLDNEWRGVGAASPPPPQRVAPPRTDARHSRALTPNPPPPPPPPPPRRSSSNMRRRPRSAEMTTDDDESSADDEYPSVSVPPRPTLERRGSGRARPPPPVLRSLNPPPPTPQPYLRRRDSHPPRAPPASWAYNEYGYGSVQDLRFLSPGA